MKARSVIAVLLLLGVLTGCGEKVPLPTVDLATAIRNSNLAEIKANLHHDRNLANKLLGDNQTPLQAAIYGVDENQAVIKMLLDYGADPNGGNGEFLPLACAGNPETAKLLLARGADPNRQADFHGSFETIPVDVLTLQARISAKGYKNTDVMRLTLDSGADPSKCRTGLALGQVQDHEVFLRLLNGGMPVRWKNAKGEVQKPERRKDAKEQDLVEQKLFETASTPVREKGIECFKVFGDDPPTDLQKISYDDIRMLKLALQSGAKPTGYYQGNSYYGPWTYDPMARAIRRADLEVVTLLAEKGYFDKNINPKAISLSDAVSFTNRLLTPHNGTIDEYGSESIEKGKAILKYLQSK